MLYVETHWILSCVLHDDPDARTLLRPLEAHVPICMPAFCIAEAIARFRTLEKEAHEFRERLKKSHHDASRRNIPAAKRLTVALETAIREQDYMIEQLPTTFETFMEELFASSVVQIPVDRAVVHRANAYVESHDMSRGDALVLATVLEHAATHEPPTRVFLSGNTGDFGQRSRAGEELRRASFKVFSKAGSALGFMNANRFE